MASLVEVIERSILDRGLFERGQRILVAVSGGVDSMVLLEVLHQLSVRNQWRLTVGHLNHQLRGRSSNADERLVRLTAKKLHLPFAIERINVSRLMQRQKISLEMAARKARHDFLARTARRLRIGTVAVAHHADDQVELFLLRMLRGSGTQGLSGMRARNASPTDRDIQLVRPLLEIPKEQLKRYARQNKIKFREDSTNASLDILRNRIRHELVPLLKKRYQPALDLVVVRTMEILREESEFAEQAAAAALEKMRAEKNERKSRTFFDGLDTALQRRVLQLQLIELGIPPDFDLIEALRVHPNKNVTAFGQAKPGLPTASNALPSQNSGLKAKSSRRFRPATVVSRDSRGHLQKSEVAASEFRPESVILKVVPGKTKAVRFEGLKLWCQIKEQQGSGVPKHVEGLEYFDADRVGKEVILRHWHPGDRFQPIGMRTAVKIQDFLTNQKIPRRKRHEMVLAATAGGEVFWIEGMRISDRFKLGKGTNRRLLWAWERL